MVHLCLLVSFLFPSFLTGIVAIKVVERSAHYPPHRYKMAQLRYYRAEKDRVDTTVLLLPDTSALMPDEECYREQLAVLKNQLATKISAVEAMKVEQSMPAEVAGGETGQQSSHHGTGEAAASEPTKEQVRH